MIKNNNTGKQIWDPCKDKVSSEPTFVRNTYPVWIVCFGCKGTGIGKSKPKCVHCKGGGGRRVRMLPHEMTAEHINQLSPYLKEKVLQEQFLLDRRNLVARAMAVSEVA